MLPLEAAVGLTEMPSADRAPCSQSEVRRKLPNVGSPASGGGAEEIWRVVRPVAPCDASSARAKRSRGHEGQQEGSGDVGDLALGIAARAQGMSPDGGFPGVRYGHRPVQGTCADYGGALGARVEINGDPEGRRSGGEAHRKVYPAHPDLRLTLRRSLLGRAPQSAGQSSGHDGFGVCLHAGIPLFEFAPKGSVECPGAGLKHEVGALL